jgi:hypothetical protein
MAQNVMALEKAQGLAQGIYTFREASAALLCLIGTLLELEIDEGLNLSLQRHQVRKKYCHEQSMPRH